MEENISSEQFDPKQYLLKVPIPASTSTYKTVSHGTLMQLTLTAIKDCGFELVKEVYTYRKNGMVANGKYKGRFNALYTMLAFRCTIIIQLLVAFCTLHLF